MASTGVVAEYSWVLPTGPKPNIRFFLKGIDKERLLEIAAHLISLERAAERNNDWKYVLSWWFTDPDDPFKRRVIKGLEALEKKEGKKYTVIYTPAILRLIDYVLQNEYTVVGKPQTLIDSERNILRAILYFNEEEFRKYEQQQSQLKGLPLEEFNVRYFLIYSFPVSDIVNVDINQIATAQLVKAFAFFDFISKNDKCQILFSEWLRANDFKDWKDYFKEVYPVIQIIINNNREGRIILNIDDGQDFEKNIKALDKLTINLNDSEVDFDYKHLRAHPLYSLSDNEFLVISPLFLVEHIYRALYFEFKNINEKGHEAFVKDWRGVYTKNFSESYLLYFLLTYIFQNQVDEIYSGDELKAKGVKGEPDFYIRSGDKILLFENKDNLIGADIKISADFSKLENEIKKRLFKYLDEKSKEKPAAVKQLLNNAEKLLLNQESIDGYKFNEETSIQPIVVVHDPSFNALGVNAMVRKWFCEELKGLTDINPTDKDRIKTPVVIHIDYFILYLDYLKENPSHLIDLVDSYNHSGVFRSDRAFVNEEHYKSEFMKTLLPFSIYADNKTIFGYTRSKREFFNELLKKVGF